MSIDLVTTVVLGAVYAAGFFLLMQRSLMRVILGFVVVGHGANLFLQVAGGPPGLPAFVGLVPGAAMSDPLPQALALTAVVITFGLTTFLLALAYRAWVLLGDDEVQDDLEDRRIAQALAEADARQAEADAEVAPGSRDTGAGREEGPVDARTEGGHSR
ncbi:NADH-quinone oxidoreductase subunit K [Saccharomonospora saliphila]|uniref:NADH-quinone oxidoreductase subunit K n=1 Tax=Saccharomonospora saliphila TaxID=369829 RepID=UPI0003659168|nr:NADH-quinone oxidoreductase subunit K [Saccharomonospora saliphila]